MPKVGEVWRSRDSRDHGLLVTILAVEDERVQIKRFNKTWVKLSRFHKDYEKPIEVGDRVLIKGGWCKGEYATVTNTPGKVFNGYTVRPDAAGSCIRFVGVGERDLVLV